MFLKLSGMIEGQLRDAYAKKYEAGALNQSSLANKLGVNRSAVHHRLTGRTNMTIETIADMIWGLDHDVDLKIFDPTESTKNSSMAVHAPLSQDAVQSFDADTTLMKIASTAPTSNTAAPVMLGGAKRIPAPSQALLNYSAQLTGTK
jgi:hypothetical protein